jgi:hypothetical protein
MISKSEYKYRYSNFYSVKNPLVEKKIIKLHHDCSRREGLHGIVIITVKTDQISRLGISNTLTTL